MPDPGFDGASLCELFQRTASRAGDGPALRTADGTVAFTWEAVAAEVRVCAAGLAGLGVARGDTVALMMGNRPEFHILDTAALHLGATAFSIYTTFTPETIAHLLRSAGAAVVICAGEHLEAVLGAREGSAVQHVVALEGADPRALSFNELKEGAEPDFDFKAAWRAVDASDVATLIYTSGTTGPPKGVELTHGNVLAELAATATVLPVELGDSVPSAFPMAHAAERWATHYQWLAFGLDVTCVDDLKSLPQILLRTRPQIWGSVPRVWEKLYAALDAMISSDVQLSDTVQRGLAGAATDSDEQIFAHLRAKIGLDRVRWAVVGSAPTPRHVLEFFTAIGVPICELWGMSELTSCATVNPPNAVKLGTVGRPLPSVELRLADDGEIEVRGPIVMRGYRGEPEKTAETIAPEGWLRTGDIGTIDPDGYLTIVDRKKEIIINASGKNMSPANIEAALKGSSPLIGHAVAIGDGRPYVSALLVLDPDAVAAYATERDIEADPAMLAADGELMAAFDAAVAQANDRLARVEQVKRFAILDGYWEPGSDMLTPTLKLRRKPIAERYAAVIDRLYTTPA